jgi:hypothetical protein
VVKNRAEPLIDSIHIHRDAELLQVMQVFVALLRRDLLPPFSNHEGVHYFQSPDGRHDDGGSVDDNL